MSAVELLVLHNTPNPLELGYNVQEAVAVKAIDGGGDGVENAEIRFEFMREYPNVPGEVNIDPAEDETDGDGVAEAVLDSGSVAASLYLEISYPDDENVEPLYLHVVVPIP